MQRASRRLVHTARARAIVTAAATAALLIVAPSSAGSDTLTIETFTGTTVTNPAAWVAGGSGGSSTGWPGQACLTASADTTQTPIAGCGLGTPDAAGSGVLNLTPAAPSRAGFALYNSALPTVGGLDISFQQSQWGGSGADGISFFLVDGATNLTQPGQNGRALGYSTHVGVGPGVDNGLIGIGIDSWGEFSGQMTGGSGCAPGTGPGSTGPGYTPNRVAVRGPGNGTVGYCWLGMSDNLSSLGLAVRGATRADGDTTVRIVFDPSSAATRNVTVFLDGIQVVQVPAPAELIAATSFKFGFGGATGDVTDNHDVWGLTVQSVDPVAPTTTTTTTSTTTTTTTVPAPTTPATRSTATPVVARPSFTG